MMGFGFPEIMVLSVVVLLLAATIGITVLLMRRFTSGHRGATLMASRPCPKCAQRIPDLGAYCPLCGERTA